MIECIESLNCAIEDTDVLIIHRETSFDQLIACLV